MNYFKLIQAVLENRKGNSNMPKPLSWALKHYKLIIGAIVALIVIFVMLIFALLIVAIIFFTRGIAQVPNTESIIQSGREYLDQQFGIENQKLDQLQKEVQELKQVITNSPQPESQQE
jgi:predicted PurR-regulated permease PerM